MLGITAKPATVRALKEKWEKNAKRHSRRYDISLETFLEYYEQGLTYGEIGELLQITPQRVQQIEAFYHIRDLYGFTKAVTRKHFARARQREEDLRNRPLIKRVLALAEDAGCTVKVIWRRDTDGEFTGYIESHTLLINEHRVGIHLLQSLWCPRMKESEDLQAYARTELPVHTLIETDFKLFYAAPGKYTERLFIVPTNDLREAFDNRPSAKAKIYLPINDPTTHHHGRPGKIDFRIYLNKWMLLSRKH